MGAAIFLLRLHALTVGIGTTVPLPFCKLRPKATRTSKGQSSDLPSILKSSSVPTRCAGDCSELTHCSLTFKARLNATRLVVLRRCGVYDDEELRMSTANCGIWPPKKYSNTPIKETNYLTCTLLLEFEGGGHCAVVDYAWKSPPLKADSRLPDQWIAQI